MAKFRKKPVVVDAVLWDCTQETLDIVNGWWQALGQTDQFSMNPSKVVPIRTLEGTVLAIPGDYIIRGIKGDIYPLKPDIFDLTYEKVE
jgi:hypothetical protein